MNALIYKSCCQNKHKTDESNQSWYLRLDIIKYIFELPKVQRMSVILWFFSELKLMLSSGNLIIKLSYSALQKHCDQFFIF